MLKVGPHQSRVPWIISRKQINLPWEEWAFSILADLQMTLKPALKTMFMWIVHIPIPVLLYQLQPSIHCIYTGKSSGSQVLDHHCKDRRYQPRQENREGLVFNWGRNQNSPGFQEISTSSSSLTLRSGGHSSSPRVFMLSLGSASVRNTLTVLSL